MGPDSENPANETRRPLAPRIPAWAASVVVHSLLLAMLLLALQRAPLRGAADEPGREVGIVLRRADAEGDPYTGEDDLEQPTENNTSDSQNDLNSTLPEASAAASAEFLPQRPGLGPEQVGPEGLVGDATEMSQGGAGPARKVAGGEAAVKFFNVEGVGTKFVYVLDRSVSMDMHGRLTAAKKELIKSLTGLEPIHQFQIVFFNNNTTIPDLTGGQSRVAFASDQNKRIAERFVNGVMADGGTDRFVALRNALRFSPDVIFFLTDADDPMSLEELRKIDDSNRRIGATICTIDFGSGPEHGRDNFLVQLARQTGGQYGYVDTTRLER